MDLLPRGWLLAITTEQAREYPRAIFRTLIFSLKSPFPAQLFTSPGWASALSCGPGSESLKGLGHKVSSAQEKDMPVAALEGSQGVYCPIFFLDPSRDCVILKDSFNAEIVADRAAVRPPHGLYFLSRSHPHIGVSITPKVTKSRQIISGTVYIGYLAISTRAGARAGQRERIQGAGNSRRRQ